MAFGAFPAMIDLDIRLKAPGLIFNCAIESINRSAFMLYG
jgi:hypothetical protein